MRNAGFTLVEMLMAITITATVALSAMAALDQLTDADARATEHMECSIGVYRALQTLRRDVTDAASLDLATDRLLVTRTDGTVVAYTLYADSTELHRVVHASALLVPLLVVDTVGNVGYGPRGHMRDGDYRADAIVQGAKRIDLVAVRGPRAGTLIGVKVSVYHSTAQGPQTAEALAMCLAQVEAEAKP